MPSSSRPYRLSRSPRHAELLQEPRYAAIGGQEVCGGTDDAFFVFAAALAILHAAGAPEVMPRQQSCTVDSTTP